MQCVIEVVRVTKAEPCQKHAGLEAQGPALRQGTHLELHTHSCDQSWHLELHTHHSSGTSNTQSCSSSKPMPGWSSWVNAHAQYHVIQHGVPCLRSFKLATSSLGPLILCWLSTWQMEDSSCRHSMSKVCFSDDIVKIPHHTHLWCADGKSDCNTGDSDYDYVLGLQVRGNTEVPQMRMMLSWRNKFTQQLSG